MEGIYPTSPRPACCAYCKPLHVWATCAPNDSSPHIEHKSSNTVQVLIRPAYYVFVDIYAII